MQAKSQSQLTERLGSKIADTSDVSAMMFRSKSSESDSESESSSSSDSESDDESSFVKRGWLKFFSYIPSNELKLKDKPTRFDLNEEFYD